LWQGTGELVFKRDPDFVRLYPAPSLTDARARWEFAITSVLDSVRRQAWSSKRIFQRLKDGKRFRELILRQYYGRDWGADEVEEYYSLLPGMYETDAQFYASVINVKLSNTAIFDPFTCDNCQSVPGGSRIVCMDCHRTTTTLDLCSEPECVNSTVKVDIVLHLPNHGMFKVRRFVFSRDIAKVGGEAKEALSSARKTISELKKEEKPMPECMHCKTLVSLPCWYCVECTAEEREGFICETCEQKDRVPEGMHTEMHTVVRVSEEVRGEPSTEERLRLVEDELAKMRRTLAEMTETLGRLAEKSAEWSRGETLTKGDTLAAAIDVGPSQPEAVPAMD